MTKHSIEKMVSTQKNMGELCQSCVCKIIRCWILRTY